MTSSALTSSLLSRLLIAASVASIAAGCETRSNVPKHEKHNQPSRTKGEPIGTAGAHGSGRANATGGTSGTSGTSGTGGQVGTGGNAVCDNPNSPKLESNGEYLCANPREYGVCELRCYSPGSKTFPAPCLAANDPKLNTLPQFKLHGCGVKRITSGPYCTKKMETAGGGSPICCYIALNQPCPGRSLVVAGHARLAPLVRKAYL
jgi:hypothetical protein